MKHEVKIIYHEEQKVFHLYNEEVSYIMMVLPDGELGQLYFGQRIHDKENFSYLLELAPRPMSSCVFRRLRPFHWSRSSWSFQPMAARIIERLP